MATLDELQAALGNLGSPEGRAKVALLAVELAIAAIENSDPDTAKALRPIRDRLAGQAEGWRPAGSGWLEERHITKVVMVLNRETRRMEPQQRTYGPYYYFRHKDAMGKTHTAYHGKVDPRATGEVPATTPVVSAAHNQLGGPSDQSAEGRGEGVVDIGHGKEHVDQTAHHSKEHVDQLPRLEAVTIKGKPHLRAPGQTLTLCKRLGNVQPGYSPPPADTICKRCLSKAKAMQLLCSGCEEPLIVASATPGICQRCGRAGAGG